MLMNKDRTAFLNNGLRGDDEEDVHVFSCYHCGAKTMITDQEYNTALFPLVNLVCTCGYTVLHHTEYHKKTWVDKNLRSK